MLPHQRNKVDMNAMTEEERKLFRLYGKLPSKKDILKNKLKERKYFDSGDYALSKAGKASDVGVTNIGSQHPLPENIPHCHKTTQPGEQPTNANGNPVPPIKEASHLHSKSPMASEEPITSEQVESTADEEKAEAEGEPKPEEKPVEEKEQGGDEEATPESSPVNATSAPVPIPSQG